MFIAFSQVQLWSYPIGRKQYPVPLFSFYFWGIVSNLVTHTNSAASYSFNTLLHINLSLHFEKYNLTGQYVHQPDTFGDDGQYVHQPDTFGPDGGQYKDTSIYGYQVAVPSNPFPIPARLPAPPKTYLPARTPASPPFKKVEPVRVVNIPARPIFSPAPKPASRPYSPISPAPASISGSVTGQGPYKWRYVLNV